MEREIYNAYRVMIAWSNDHLLPGVPGVPGAPGAPGAPGVPGVLGERDSKKTFSRKNNFLMLNKGLSGLGRSLIEVFQHRGFSVHRETLVRHSQ